MEVNMNDRLFVLLVHDQPEPLESLKHALKTLPVETCTVRTCEEVRRLLAQTEPHIVFTDTFLPDGSWVDVVNLAENAPVSPNVIVVGGTTNMKLYVSAIERGAFDFVLPPFELQGLAHIVRSAGHDVRYRRQVQARVATA
jgi:DNA-binding NtrC family response regulator